MSSSQAEQQALIRKRGELTNAAFDGIAQYLKTGAAQSLFGGTQARVVKADAKTLTVTDGNGKIFTVTFGWRNT